jgi:exopolyphosphatase/guanosine-5'-triphosphate,3'-diphosphate pyrophosphatase
VNIGVEFSSEIPDKIQPVNLDFWMAGVLRECDGARRDFNAEVIHDLRVALRRCRSIADGFRAFDPHPAWKQMKNEGKRLFRQLGALRDTQVMMEWVERLVPAADEASIIMRSHLASEESRLKESASEALREFDQRKWTSWMRLLSRRAHHIPVESMAFQHIALERWSEARALHRQALRNRSHVAYHRLRIGLKKFRYTIESFLPTLHASWGAALRELQDLLGEMHDLHVLWQTALAINAIRDERTRAAWRQRISEESHQRLEAYRKKMSGETSLLQLWRSGLPDAAKIKMSALARLRAWASFRDPDFAHAELVARLALQIYDGMDLLGLMPRSSLDARLLLEAAAVLHDVGANEVRKKHQIASYRLIRKLDPPLDWSPETLQQVALIARFHRGALPRSEQKAFSGIPGDSREAILLLCGILRLASAFDSLHQKRIRHLELRRDGDILRIAAPGYSKADALAETLAGARHLLESACRLPILIE